MYAVRIHGRGGQGVVTAADVAVDFAIAAEDRSFRSPELRKTLDKQLSKRDDTG